MPWELERPGVSRHSLLTEFKIPTYGATDEALQLQFIRKESKKQSRGNDTDCIMQHGSEGEKNHKWYGRCALCVTDIALSWDASNCTKKQRRSPSMDADTVKINSSAFNLVENHACTRIHQCAVLAYKKGVRDALKGMAEFCKRRSQVHAGASENTCVDVETAFMRCYKMMVPECDWLEGVLNSNMPDDLVSGDDDGLKHATPATLKALGMLGSSVGQ